MGISYIPGPEEQLGPALAQIAGAIGDIAKPNAKFQQAFQQAIIARPEILQQLADLEGRSPGTISKRFAPLIGPELADVISKMTPSLAVRTENLVGPQVTRLANTPVSELPSQATTPASIAAVRELTGARPEELTAEQASGEARMYAAEFVSHLTDDEKRNLGVYGTSAGILADPTFVRQLILGRQLARERRADTIHDYMLQKQIANATWWQQKTGQGTIDDWLSYFSPAGAARFKQIEQGGPLKPGDERLLAVGSAFEQAPAMLRSAFLNTAVDNVRQLIPAIKNAEGAARAALIASLNETLRSTGSGYEARWTDAKTAGGAGSFFRKTELRFFDSTGKELDPETALNLIRQGPQRSQPSPQPELDRARARARELQAQGKSREQIRAILKQEGFNIQ